MFLLKVDFDSKKWLLSLLYMRIFICILVLIGNMQIASYRYSRSHFKKWSNILIKLFSYLVLCSKYKFSLSWLILIQLKLILLWSAVMERNSYNWPWRVRLFVWTQSIWPLWKYEYAFPRIPPYDSEHKYFKQKNIWLIRNDGTKQRKELVIIRNISLSLVSIFYRRITLSTD